MQIIAKMEEKKIRMAPDHVESKESPKEYIIEQRVEEIKEKVVQIRSKWE
jgi:hypothetical protein